MHLNSPVRQPIIVSHIGSRQGWRQIFFFCNSTFPVLLIISFSALWVSGVPVAESNYEGSVEFDPIKHHNTFCPWVNGNVAAAGSTSEGSSSSAIATALCGWQLTLDALDAFQSLGQVPIQTVESESAASRHKVDWICIIFTHVAACVFCFCLFWFWNFLIL